MTFCVCSIFDGKKHHVGISQFFALPECVKKNFKSLGYNGAFDAAGVVPDDTGLGVLHYVVDECRVPLRLPAIDGAMVSLLPIVTRCRFEVVRSVGVFLFNR